LSIKSPTPEPSENTGTPSSGNGEKTEQLSVPKSTIILTTPSANPVTGTENTGTNEFGKDDQGKVEPVAGTIDLVVGKKQIVVNQIVPIVQTLTVSLPKGTVKAEIYLNGKKQDVTVLSGTPFKLSGIIGPKDKVMIKATDAKGDVVMAPMAYKSRPIALANVNFDFSSAKLTPAAISILNKTITVVRDHGFTSITLVGHTDSKTTKVFSNQNLSNNRTSSVMNYLSTAFAKYNIKVKFTGSGKSDKTPLTTNGTDQGRAINRRVEIDVQ